MHTEKYKMPNCGLLRECNRTMYIDKDTTSKSDIDHSRTPLNYNICDKYKIHSQYTPEEIKRRIEKTTKKKMRKDGVCFGMTVITAPEEIKNGNTEGFFLAAYEGLKEIYGIRDEDIISAYVHLDERTPHMHFTFIPHVYEKTDKDGKVIQKETISWDKVMPRQKYKDQHEELEAYLKSCKFDVKLLNGKTKGVDFSKMTVEEKKLYNEIESLKEEQKSLKEANTSLQRLNENLKRTVKQIYNELKREGIFPGKGHKENAQRIYEEELLPMCEEIEDEYER